MLYLLSNCANQGALSGGPKDITPPQLDSIKSTPNFRTNFRPEKITLYFDEWIKLKQKNQILVSPPLTKKLNITQRGKHVDIKFNEEDTLRENTTYNINFGKSIIDFTEGNPCTDLLYVFSTGDKIDSLELSGKVINSVDNKPIKDITVMLYATNEDSIVVKSKPYYTSISDEKGNFKIKYIKNGYYKLFALGDENGNYLYDLETEKIGYIDSMIHVFDDTVANIIDVKVFTPIPDLRVIENSVVGFGKIKITYNREPLEVKIITSSVEILNKQIQNDSFLIYYDNAEKSDSIYMVLEAENTVDTLKFKLRKKYSTPDLLVEVKEKSNFKIHPDKKINITFNQPIHLTDKSKIVLLEKNTITKKDTSTGIDTSKIFVDVFSEIDSIDSRTLNIWGKWQEGKRYQLFLYPNSINGLFGNTIDTILSDIAVGKREDFGTINCQLDSLDSEKSYIILLKNKKNTIEERYIQNSTKELVQYKALKPGTYELEVIEDSNLNKRWDFGSYFRKEKTEKKYSFKLNELKSNWVQDEKIIIRNHKGL